MDEHQTVLLINRTDLNDPVQLAVATKVASKYKVTTDYLEDKLTRHLAERRYQ